MGMLMHHTWLAQNEAEKPKEAVVQETERNDTPVEDVPPVETKNSKTPVKRSVGRKPVKPAKRGK